MNDLEITQSSHANGRSGLWTKQSATFGFGKGTYVGVEHEEWSCQWEKRAGIVRRETICNGCHGMLSYTVTKKSTSVLKIPMNEEFPSLKLFGKLTFDERRTSSSA